MRDLRHRDAQLTGEAAPKYGRALRTWLLALLFTSIATTTYGLTLGWFVPTAIDLTISGVMLIGITAMVYRRQLGGSFLQAMIVALLHNGLAAGLSALTWYLVQWVR